MYVLYMFRKHHSDSNCECHAQEPVLPHVDLYVWCWCIFGYKSLASVFGWLPLPKHAATKGSVVLYFLQCTMPTTSLAQTPKPAAVIGRRRRTGDKRAFTLGPGGSSADYADSGWDCAAVGLLKSTLMSKSSIIFACCGSHIIFDWPL